MIAVDDRRSFNVFNLGQDWLFELGDRQVVKWGFDLTWSDAEYRYFHSSTFGSGSEASVVLEPEGTAVGLYASDRVRLAKTVVVEVGLRWDRQTWMGPSQISPRLNLSYQPSPHTTVRAAWGRFHQSQRLNELQVEDGVDHFSRAQLAEHWLAGVEHELSPRLGARLELYSKNLSHLRPRYENLFNPIELFPEATSDRVLIAPGRGRARGLELVLKGSRGERTSWWASYSLAVAEDRIDGAWQPRSWDQRHAVAAGVDVKCGRGWNLNLAAAFHSGWPTTGLTAELESAPNGEPVVRPMVGPRNAERLPSYHRVDVRASKRIPTRVGAFTLTLEVLNLTARKNVCCIEDFAFVVGEDGSVAVEPQRRYWAPIIPSIAVGWSF